MRNFSAWMLEFVIKNASKATDSMAKTNNKRLINRLSKGVCPNSRCTEHKGSYIYMIYGLANVWPDFSTNSNSNSNNNNLNSY